MKPSGSFGAVYLEMEDIYAKSSTSINAGISLI